MNARAARVKMGQTAHTLPWQVVSDTIRTRARAKLAMRVGCAGTRSSRSTVLHAQWRKGATATSTLTNARASRARTEPNARSQSMRMRVRVWLASPVAAWVRARRTWMSVQASHVPTVQSASIHRRMHRCLLTHTGAFAKPGLPTVCVTTSLSASTQIDVRYGRV